jgi:DNA (cytosine-5)-methyltransferase 1
MYNNNTIVPYISLCSGYEGIGLGLHRCIPNLRAVAYCEREAFACANLVSKMENGLLDAAPIFTDVTTFPWADYAPYMAGGILSFGWPCQPVSCAGKRQATEDERWLFDIIADGISILKPGMLFAENVEGLLSAKMPDGSSVFGHCIQRLESLHYKVTAGIFSASEVGAPHQRKRVFILGHSNSTPWFDVCGEKRIGEELNEFGIASGNHKLGDTSGTRYSRAARSSSECSERQPSGHIAESNGGIWAWPSRPGEPQHGWEPPRVVGAVPKKLADFCSRDAQSWGDTSQAGGESTCERGQGEDAMSDGGSGVCGGDQGDEPEVVGNAEGEQSSSRDHRGEQGTPCEPQQVESGGGDCGALRESNWEAQPSLGGDADGPSDWMDYAELYTTCDNRTDELRLLGNGVVPATAERAFRTLLKELYEQKTHN